MKINVSLSLTFFYLLFVAHVNVSASEPTSGTFTAIKQCPAYSSMRKKENPGNVQVEVGQTYDILERNKPEGATWYRIAVSGADPTERWVAVGCGKLDIQGGTLSKHKKKEVCNIKGLTDSFVLALSWQPAFCEAHREKPECRVTDTQAYQAGHFTLHGLWPNKRACKTKYGFCGTYAKAVKPFCDYTAVPMQPETLQKLGKFMPSAKHGTCLQRHEWYKHGTCQVQFDADGYFEQAIRLVQEFNNSGVAKFMQDNVGQTVATKDFFAVVDNAFYKDAHKNLKIICKQGLLVDVYVNLPKTLPKEASLVELLRQATPKFNNQCGNKFKVDKIGFTQSN